jgi:hypothetical protein
MGLDTARQIDFYSAKFLWTFLPLKNKKTEVSASVYCYDFGSGERIRTFDLVVTRDHSFRMCVDYLFIRKGCRALLEDYCSAHLLVSEPSKVY